MKSLGGRKIKKINQARSRLYRNQISNLIFGFDTAKSNLFGLGGTRSRRAVLGGMQPEDYFRFYRGMAASVLWRKKLGKRAILAGQKLFYLLVFVHCSEGVVVLWRVLEAQFVTCTNSHICCSGAEVRKSSMSRRTLQNEY